MPVAKFQDLPHADRGRLCDGAAVEKRWRRWAGVEDKPNAEYRDARVWYDLEKKDQFGSYQLLIADLRATDAKSREQGFKAFVADLGVMAGLLA